MNNKKMKMMCVVSALCLTTSVFAAESSKLSLDKNNIKVWTIQDPYKSLMSYKAETILNTSIDRAVAIVLDVEYAKSWVPNVAHAEILSQDLNKGEFKLYMVLDFPFPLKDRDVIVQGKVFKDANGFIYIKNKAIQQGKAKNPDYVRLQDYQGNWMFQPLAEQKVKVTTTGYADPEGVIPQSVTNLLLKQQPYQMLLKMRAELNKPNKQLPDLPKILK